MYDFLLKTIFKDQWRKIGTDRRAGVIFPLFSIHSKNSAGTGEFPDLNLAIDWCKITGNSILQVLPLNDTGFQISPFCPQTSIGLNPIHISLSRLKGVTDTGKIRLTDLSHHEIGMEKIKILRLLFDKEFKITDKFNNFVTKNNFWLEDFCLFRTLKRHHGERSWKKWEEKYKNRDRKSIDKFSRENKKEILFWKWVQWQAFEQLREVKEYATRNNVLMKGDIPLFVSDDSVDCWTNGKYFKMDLSSGAPPDKFSEKGQIWGMPPYDWDAIIKDNFRFFRQRIVYAENFYHLFRIDHVIGLFRTWSVKTGSKSAKNGSFDLKKTADQKERGEKILRLMSEWSDILPCAEDLGTIPNFCREALYELGIPGLDVGRNQNNYRSVAVSTLSTHDMSLFPAWLKKKGLTPERKYIEKGVNEVLASPSIFSVLLIFDWLFFSETMNVKEADNYRINNPGINSEKNWNVRMSMSMENLLADTCNDRITRIINETKRFSLPAPKITI